jgi:HAMP domain-containing protein
VIVVIVAQETWALVRPLRGATLRATLFRGAFFALIGLLVVIVALFWWGERRNSREAASNFDGSDEALAWLNIAYTNQPVKVSPSAPTPADGPVIEGRGLWIDAASYERIRHVIAESSNDGTVENGQMTLDGSDGPPLRALLPKGVSTDGVGQQDYQYPSGVSASFDAPYNVDPGQYRQLGLYIKEHGAKFGTTVVGHGQGRGMYAIWRTGANTAYYVVYQASGETWWLRSLSFGVQGFMIVIGVYILLAPFAALCAWYLNRRIVRPVGQVAAASVELADGRHPEPIPETGPAELATLAGSFNRMSAKLEQAETAEREFLLSVGHELKTPLTAIEG